MTDDTHTTDMNGCARCEAGGHQQVVFTKLTHPIRDAGGDFTHWAPCPTNGEPILLRFVDLPEEEA